MYKNNFISFNLLNRKNASKSQNYSLIKHLKDHPVQQQIISILETHRKNQEKDYFKTEPNIIFNQKPKGPKFDKNNKLIPYTYVGPANIFSSNNNSRKYYSSNKVSYADSSQSLNTSRRQSRRSSKKIVFKKIIDGNKNSQICFLNSNSLSKIYSEIKDRIKNNKKNYEREESMLFLDFPKFIKKNIINQENILSKFSDFKKQREKVQKKLLKRTLKENNQELLINKSNDYIVKNQVNLYKDKNEDIDKKYGDNLWSITLRNPSKNGEYEHIGFQNVGSITEPKYTSFNLSRTAEFCSTPECKSKIKIKNLNNLVLSNLEIKGKNLLDFETNKEIGFKGKKVYYKPNEIDCLLFKEKNKVNILTDEDKKKYFGEQTYAENFNKKDFYKNQSLNNKYTKSVITSNI